MTITRPPGGSGPSLGSDGRQSRTGLWLAVVGVVVLVMGGLGALALGWISHAGEPDACGAEAIEARAAAEQLYATVGTGSRPILRSSWRQACSSTSRCTSISGTKGDQAHASPKPGADCAVGTD